MALRKFAKDIQTLFDNLPDKYRSQIEVSVTSRYNDRIDIRLFDDCKPPKIVVYDMDNKYSKLEGVYANIDELKNVVDEYKTKHKINMLIREHEGIILVGRGKLTIIGKLKIKQ